MVQLQHGLVDPGNATVLGIGTLADLIDQGRHLGAGLHHLSDGLAGQIHAAVTFLNAIERLPDQAVDLLGRIGTAPGQGAHLASHHGKAAALLARAGGLDGGIERQQIGLEGNAFNGVRDLAHARRAGPYLRHRLRHGGNFLAALATDLGAVLAVLGHAPGNIDGVLHRGGNVLHCRAGVHQALGLRFHPLHQVVGAVGNVVGGADEGTNLRAHVPHHGLQVDLDLLHAVHQPPQRAGVTVVHLGGEVAAGNVQRVALGFLQPLHAKVMEVHQ